MCALGPLADYRRPVWIARFVQRTLRRQTVTSLPLALAPYLNRRESARGRLSINPLRGLQLSSKNFSLVLLRKKRRLAPAGEKMPAILPPSVRWCQ
jgi:hypothetical protein